MTPVEILLSIKPAWLKRVVLSLARGSQVKEDLTDQFELFFNQLQQSIETGDPGWFDPLLNTWAASLTQSDLEGELNTLTQFVKELMLITHSLCIEILTAEQAVILLDGLLPIYAYILEKSAFYETEAKVGYVTKQLEQVRTTLEKLDRSKSGFIAVAAHELKTPLTLVDGYTAMLRDSLRGKSDSQSQYSFLEGIEKGTHRLKTIIDDMVDVSLIDNNLLNLNFQPFWLNRLLDVLFFELHNIIEERKLNLHIEKFDGFEEVNFGDPERLLQVLRNVILNAIKFTPDGGSIKIDGRKLPGFVETRITDTGIGIAAEDQSIIFEKFSRIASPALHSSGKTKFKGGGPGLGLHIAKGIIEAHGGAIWAESIGYDETCCPGSTFHILLPLRETPPDDLSSKLFENIKQSENLK
ncbi:MAG: hypothetical protein CVU39_02510 [Chloroflexi bacterium HGW-Chloroflexi-10]|jgi:signal transduction histidine kinase|nr:MAG: hypothetical protein CVU39_02510 [Chloroflexi bacterium HGW-Chloroflexi-10]